MLKLEMMANIFNEIHIGEASPEKAGVGGSIPSLATIQITRIFSGSSSPLLAAS